MHVFKHQQFYVIFPLHCSLIVFVIFPFPSFAQFFCFFLNIFSSFLSENIEFPDKTAVFLSVRSSQSLTKWHACSV